MRSLAAILNETYLHLHMIDEISDMHGDGQAHPLQCAPLVVRSTVLKHWDDGKAAAYTPDMCVKSYDFHGHLAGATRAPCGAWRMPHTNTGDVVRPRTRQWKCACLPNMTRMEPSHSKATCGSEANPTRQHRVAFDMCSR